MQKLLDKKERAVGCKSPRGYQSTKIYRTSF